MNRQSFAALGFATVLLVPGAAHASGFFIYESSPASAAEGGAYSAAGEEPSTLLYNPAGMTRLPGFQAQIVLTTYIATNSFEDPSGKRTNADLGLFPIPAEFVTWKPIDKLAVGIGGYSIYGLTLKWPDKWEGYGIVGTASLRSYQAQPSIAIGPFAGLSFGAGLDIIYGSVDLSRGLPLGSGQWGSTELGGSTVGYGANFGLLYEPMELLRIGVTYRTGLTMKLDPGEATFTVPPAFDQQLKGQNVRVGLNLPPITQFGARVKPTKDLELEADATFLQWSKYKELAFHFDDPSIDNVAVKNWKDSWELRIGGQYSLDRLALRAGFLYDMSPIPDSTLDPTLPDSARLIPSVGAGYQFTKAFRADLSYMLVYFLPRSVDASVNPLPGKYRTLVNGVIAGVTLAL